MVAVDICADRRPVRKTSPARQPAGYASRMTEFVVTGIERLWRWRLGQEKIRPESFAISILHRNGLPVKVKEQEKRGLLNAMRFTRTKTGKKIGQDSRMTTARIELAIFCVTQRKCKADALATGPCGRR